MNHFTLQFNPDKYPNPHNALKKIAKKVAKSTEDYFDNVEEVLDEVYDEGVVVASNYEVAGAVLSISDGRELMSI